jgi:hypothetical protein
VSRLYLTGREILKASYPAEIEAWRGRVLGIAASQLLSPEQKREPMQPFVVHLGVTDSAGVPALGFETDRGYPAGYPGNGWVVPGFDGGDEQPHYSGNSAPEVPQVSAIVEYGYGTVTHSVEFDFKTGSYQFPPSEFARLSVRVRNPMASLVDNGPGLYNVGLSMSSVPGTVANPHPLTYTVPLKLYPVEGSASYVRGVFSVLPAKARAVEAWVDNVADPEDAHAATLVRVTGEAARLVRQYALPAAQVVEPPFSPVPLQKWRFSASDNGLTFYAESQAGSHAWLVFYLSP